MCDTCDSTGYVTTYERHPYGSTYATETLRDLCPDCLWRDVCPSCGVEGKIVWVPGKYHDRARCPACEWVES